MKIRADLVKVSKNLHTWVGITAGIFLFICFFAGGLTMFQHDLSKWASPPAQRLAPIELNQYNSLIQQVQQQYPEAYKAGFELNFSSKELHNAPMQWEPPHAEEEHDEHHFETAQGRMLATLDDQGQLLVKQENVSKVGWLIEQLHETAGVPGMLGHHTLGVYIMGVVAVLYFLAIMSGLIVLLPTLVKDFFAIRGGKNKKRFWLDTHNVVGIVSLPFHIIIAVTVIVFAFHDLLYGAMGALAKQSLFERSAPTVVINEAQSKLDIEKIYQKLQQYAPEHQILAMRLGNLEEPQKASAFAALYHPDQMLRGDNFAYMSFNPYQNDAYDNSTLYEHSGVIDKLINSIFSLHFGNFGGDPTRWLYFILGIGGAFLFYSGNILWVETRLKKQKNPNLPPPQQRKDVIFMANLTVGACLGCVLAVFASLLFLRWAYVINPQLLSINHIMMYSYYSIFIISMIYTFGIGVAKALPQLFLMIALVLLAIPVTSIIAITLPNLGLWHAGIDLIWIDVFAIIFALAFLRFYQQAHTRSQVASEGSIWSARKLKMANSEK